MIKCSKCNFSNKKDSIFCANCGKPLVILHICEKCEKQYDDKNGFCPDDGGVIVEKKIEDSTNYDLSKYNDNNVLLNILKFFLIVNILAYPVFIGLVFDAPDFASESFLYLLLFCGISLLISVVIFLIWVFRSYENLKALGVKYLKFTPISSVLWYFVPLVNFIMIHRSMKEIWIYSDNPINPKIKDGDYKLVLDWSTLIFLNFLIVIPFVPWFLIYITIKLTSKITEFQNRNYKILKNIVKVSDE